MSMGHFSGYMASRSFSRDRSVVSQRLAKGTARRILRYARPYRRHISVFLVTTVIAAASAAAVPLLLGYVIDSGVVAGTSRMVRRRLTIGPPPTKRHTQASKLPCSS